MTKRPANTREIDAWEFWQRSKKALDELNDMMQVMASAITQDDPTLQLPHHVVKDVKRSIARFQENFSFLVHVQKKKVSR